MIDSQIKKITPFQAEDLTGVVIDGIPYLYWLRVYKALGMRSDHAGLVLKKLIPEKHFIRFTKQEMREKYPTIDTVSIVDSHASVCYFLTEEGLNRAIMEIRTSEMNNPDAITLIEKRKDEMAHIFTRYKRGEVLNVATEQPAPPGPVEYPQVSVVLADQMAIARVMIGEGVEPAIARSMAFSVTEDICHCGDTLTPWRNLIETDPLLLEPAILTPTDIGKSLGGLSAISVNKLLEKCGYQVRTGSEWTPTMTGKLYARYVPQEIKHNRGVLRHMQLKWLPEIVEKLRNQMYYQDRGQTGLFMAEIGG